MLRPNAKINRQNFDLLAIPEEGERAQVLLTKFEELSTETERGKLVEEMVNRSPVSQDFFFNTQTNIGLYELTRYLQRSIAVIKREILTRCFSSTNATEPEYELPFLQLIELAVKERFLDRLEEHTINKFVAEYESYEKRKLQNKSLRDQILKDEKFIGRSDYFRKLDQEGMKSNLLMNPFKLFKNAKEKDDFIFELLNQPIYIVRNSLQIQSTFDLYQLICSIKATITNQKLLNQAKLTPGIKTLITEDTNAKQELVDIIKKSFKESLDKSAELTTIKSNSKHYLKSKYQGSSFKRFKHRVKSLTTSPADQYLEMYRHHLTHKANLDTTMDSNDVISKRELLHDKVIELALEYFNAEGQVDPESVRKQREAELVNVDKHAIVSFEKRANEQGIQFKVQEREGTQFHFGLTKLKLMKYAMIQHDFKEKNLRAIAERRERIEILAAQYLLRDEQKTILVAQTSACAQDISGCTIAELDGKYLIKVELLSGDTVTFVMSKSQVECFAIAQFRYNQKDFYEQSNVCLERETYLNKIKESHDQLERLACQFLMTNELENLARKIDVAKDKIMGCTITKDSLGKFHLMITIRDNQSFQLNLNVEEVENLAISQLKFKQNALQRIDKAVLKIEELAARHLMNEKKDWLAATSRINRERIVNCTIAKHKSGEYLLKIAIGEEKFKSFMLNKIIVEDLAIAQFRLSARNRRPLI